MSDNGNNSRTHPKRLEPPIQLKHEPISSSKIQEVHKYLSRQFRQQIPWITFEKRGNSNKILCQFSSCHKGQEI